MLGLWAYFWDLAGWGQPIPPIPPVPVVYPFEVTCNLDGQAYTLGGNEKIPVPPLPVNDLGFTVRAGAPAVTPLPLPVRKYVVTIKGD